MNVLCIGGPIDGRRVVLPDNQTRYEIVEHNGLSLEISEASKPIIYRTHGYNLFRLHPVTRAVLFTHESLTPTEIMERLMERYPPENYRTPLRVGERVCHRKYPRIHGTVILADPDSVRVQWDDNSIGDLVWRHDVVYSAYDLEPLREVKK